MQNFYAERTGVNLAYVPFKVEDEGVGDAESISVYSAVSGRVVASASEALKRIQVFTPMGRLVRTLYPARPTYTFDLPAGIYIIRAEIAHDQKTVKLRVQ